MAKFLSKIGIIGFGNMGGAIFEGLKKSGRFDESDFVISRNESENVDAAKNASIIIIAVKPSVVSEVLTQIKPYLTKDKVVFSVAARVTINDIQNIIGAEIPVVRVMPNICAEFGEAVSCWIKSDSVNDEQSLKVRYILESIGEEIMIEDENIFGEITIISGSGPAYFLYVAQLLSEYADKINLDPELAKRLIKQTFMGAATMLKKSGKDAKKLREEITSKGGTTEAVFDVLKKNKIDEIFIQGLDAGIKRAKGL